MSDAGKYLPIDAASVLVGQFVVDHIITSTLIEDLGASINH
jgi:hypothetical protein